MCDADFIGQLLRLSIRTARDCTLSNQYFDKCLGTDNVTSVVIVLFLALLNFATVHKCCVFMLNNYTR